MKDLKHYFTDTVKACEANSDEKEVTREPASAEAHEEEAKAVSPSSARKKRGRVKIKISQNKAKGTVCNIVDSKNDLVDKTPSPFAPRDAKGDENDTPKRSSSLPRKAPKTSLLKMSNKSALAPSDSEDKSPHKNGNQITPAPRKSNGDSDDNNIYEDRSTSTEISAGEREESNAFRVLMTRKKLVQYNAPPTLSPQEEEAAAKAAEENRNKLRQNKQKLIALADKKGYSKRKLEESEEAERIERRLEKRARVFKQMDKKESDEINPSQRVSPGSLHDYFSKATPVQKEKELTAVSTLAVQAEVHSPHLESVPEVQEIREVNLTAKGGTAGDEEMVKVTETVDDETQICKSENSTPTEVSFNLKRTKKQRWSLRINLPCNEEEANERDLPMTNGEKMSRGERESRHRKSKEKATNNEENEGSDLEVASVKSSKKRKPPSSVQKNNCMAKVEVASEALPDILPAPKSPEPEIIEIKPTRSQAAEKLAPLFVKRQRPDPAVLEARRQFLHSVPAENENPRAEQRKAPFVGAPVLPFPAISHVAQLDNNSRIQATHLKSKFPIRDIYSSFSPSFILDEFKSITNLKNNFTRNSNDSAAIAKANLDQVLSEIETRCSDAPEIWKRISITAKGDETAPPRTSPKRRGRKRKSNEKTAEAISLDKTNYVGTWTQKYRPLGAKDIVGNEDAADKLRKWLDGWKAPPLRRDDDNSSGDEFYSSDCSFASNFDNNQVAVLLGPHGSGKTASVYAIADELGYSVLEINASSKRSGKKILKELEEATKSHRIKKPDEIASLACLVKEKKAIPKNSLILVEDVDLIFEEDEGFISATFQLASNTKRPIVMTGRDICSHLNRMAPQQHRIYYQSTVGSRVAALLELITLAESGYRLPRPCLDRLLQNGDLRKALLQLQYLLLSGEPRASEIPTNFHQSLWQDMRNCIYKPAIKATKRSSKKKLANGKSLTCQKEEENLIAGLAKDLHNLSFVSTLVDIEDPALQFSSLKLEPSLSLEENTHAYSSTKNTTEEIAKWLRDRVMSGKEAVDSGGSGLHTLRQLSLKKDLSSGVNFALSQVSPNTLDSRILAVDYLPSMRAICRAEEARITTNSKRGNRFFHYLQNLKLPATSTRPNILAAACKMMREKNNSES